MATDILITNKRDLSVKREIGFVSVMEATEQTVAIAKLREKAIERRSGKGLFAKIREGMKPDQTGSMPSARFDRSFNLEPQIDKSLCILPDFRIDPKRTNFAAIAEMLLQITGEDTQSVEWKYIGNWVRAANRERLSTS